VLGFARFDVGFAGVSQDTMVPSGLAYPDLFKMLDTGDTKGLTGTFAFRAGC
jgi:hypothetical protein